MKAVDTYRKSRVLLALGDLGGLGGGLLLTLLLTLELVGNGALVLWRWSQYAVPILIFSHCSMNILESLAR